MRKTFVLRGQTASGLTEVLNFGKYKQGYAYRMTEFTLWPSLVGQSAEQEMAGTVTAAKAAEDPQNPNFNNDGLIAVAFGTIRNDLLLSGQTSVVNDTYVITQNLILSVIDTKAGAPAPVNWQCRFESVKMSGPEEASVNYKQFAISDE
jgi:hypothetical protein